MPHNPHAPTPYEQSRCKLDLYLPDANTHKNVPSVLWFYGGGLTDGHKADHLLAEIAVNFCARHRPRQRQ